MNWKCFPRFCYSHRWRRSCFMRNKTSLNFRHIDCHSRDFTEIIPTISCHQRQSDFNWTRSEITGCVSIKRTSASLELWANFWTNPLRFYLFGRFFWQDSTSIQNFSIRSHAGLIYLTRSTWFNSGSTKNAIYRTKSSLWNGIQSSIWLRSPLSPAMSPCIA